MTTAFRPGGCTVPQQSFISTPGTHNIFDASRSNSFFSGGVNCVCAEFSQSNWL